MPAAAILGFKFGVEGMTKVLLLSVSVVVLGFILYFLASKLAAKRKTT